MFKRVVCVCAFLQLSCALNMYATSNVDNQELVDASNENVSQKYSIKKSLHALTTHFNTVYGCYEDVERISKNARKNSQQELQKKKIQEKIVKMNEVLVQINDMQIDKKDIPLKEDVLRIYNATKESVSQIIKCAQDVLDNIDAKNSK